ncbi:tripartite tricarboxylate transporter TctB family protein [Pseudomonas sp. CrR14]|nr:tripartite tricarboxylate transporter TctB family protein [Pseudomonas sp. CrR14]
MRVAKRLPSPDRYTGIFFLTISALLFWACMNIKEFAAIGVGSAFVPRLTAGLLLVVGLALLIDSWRQPRAAEGETTESQQTTSSGLVGLPAVAASVISMVIYMALLDPLGFLPASALYGFAQMLILAKDAKRAYLKFALIAALPAACFYYLFVNLFDISLPAGILG